MTFMENLIAGFFEFSIAIVTFFPEERERVRTKLCLHSISRFSKEFRS